MSLLFNKIRVSERNKKNNKIRNNIRRYLINLI